MGLGLAYAGSQKEEVRSTNVFLISFFLSRFCITLSLLAFIFFLVHENTVTFVGLSVLSAASDLLITGFEE